MLRPTTFLEACFEHHSAQGDAADSWEDHSDETYYDFRSRLGLFRLRRRLSYPQTYCFTNERYLVAGYGSTERGREIVDRTLTEVEEELFYEEFLYIIVDLQEQTVRIQRDALCTLPLFVAQQKNRLVFSNRLENVYESIDAPSLTVDRNALVRYLLAADLQERTLFQEIHLLQDRRRLTWNSSRLSIYEPCDGRIAQVVRNRTADPRKFRSTLETTLDNYWAKYTSPQRPVGFELSGGLDSSLVAGYLADKKHRGVYVTARYPDEFGRSLDRKLEALRQRFNIISTTVPLDAAQDYPLAGIERQGWRAFYHGDELYSETFAKLANLLASQGAETIFTGFGGDELCERCTPHSLREPNTIKLPRTLPTFIQKDFYDYALTVLDQDLPGRAVPVASNALQGIGATHNTYLDYNIWPVAPLAGPALYLYCQSLPSVYRSRKNILRAYLQARRFPAEIYEGPNENFAPYFDMAVTQNLGSALGSFMEKSLLAKRNLIDPAKVLDAFQSLKMHPVKPTREYNPLFTIFCLLSLEINFRALGVHKI